jgi:hypothetical protein
MQFRYARHTNQLGAITEFYTSVIGLRHLGGFKDHDGYDGVFLGPENENWHLEFTQSKDTAEHTFDEDDLLVFYLVSTIEKDAILKIVLQKGLQVLLPKNPYWRQNGTLIKDPDGFHVMLALRSPALKATDTLTQEINRKGLADWDALLKYVQQLPYGRNSSRSDVGQVIREGKGSCSSKHALLKTVADLNHIPDVKLLMGIYKMNGENTPGIGSIITSSGLDHIPEAHCYLRLGERRFDLTGVNSDFSRIEKDLLEETEIQPRQVNQFKVDYHQNFIKKWLADSGSAQSFGEIWAIREKCIAALSQNRV